MIVSGAFSNDRQGELLADLDRRGALAQIRLKVKACPPALACRLQAVGRRVEAAQLGTAARPVEAPLRSRPALAAVNVRAVRACRVGAADNESGAGDLQHTAIFPELSPSSESSALKNSVLPIAIRSDGRELFGTVGRDIL